jgi:hypothetical protein
LTRQAQETTHRKEKAGYRLRRIRSRVLLFVFVLHPLLAFPHPTPAFALFAFALLILFFFEFVFLFFRLGGGFVLLRVADLVLAVLPLALPPTSGRGFAPSLAPTN